MLEGDVGREGPLLPSLTELVVVDVSLSALSTLPLCDALMKRVEQGVPLEMLDLRMCLPDPDNLTEDWIRLLREIVVYVHCPGQTDWERQQMKSQWDAVEFDPFDYNEIFGEDSSDTSGLRDEEYEIEDYREIEPM